MGVFQKIGNALARFMYGRNGVDQLSLVIVVGSLVLDLISMLVAPHLLWLGNALYTGVHRRLGLRSVPDLLPQSHQAPGREPAVDELDVADEEQPAGGQGPPRRQGPQVLHLQELQDHLPGAGGQG